MSMSILMVWNAIQEIKLWNCIVIEIATFVSHIMAGKQQIFIRIVVVQWPIHHVHCSLCNLFGILYANVNLQNITIPKTHFMWLNSIRIVLQTSLYYGQHMTIDDPYLCFLFSSASVGILFIVYLRDFPLIRAMHSTSIYRRFCQQLYLFATGTLNNFIHFSAFSNFQNDNPDCRAEKNVSFNRYPFNWHCFLETGYSLRSIKWRFHRKWIILSIKVQQNWINLKSIEYLNKPIQNRFHHSSYRKVAKAD